MGLLMAQYGLSPLLVDQAALARSASREIQLDQVKTRQTQNVFYARAAVSIKAKVAGEDLEAKTLIPQSITITGASHKKAGEATIEIEGTGLPFLPQHLDAATVTVFLGLVDRVDAPVNEAKFRRFIGFVEDYEDQRSQRKMTLKARDLSSILREHVPLIKVAITTPGKGVRHIDPTPRYQDTLGEAIKRIFSVCPGWREEDKDVEPIRLREGLPYWNIPLGTLVEGRAKKGPITIKDRSSAWDAIEHICGMCNLLVYVDLDELVVRPPKGAAGQATGAEKTGAEEFDALMADVATEFVYGGDLCNLNELQFHKKFVRNRKGILVRATNPETRQVMSAEYPSDDELRRGYPNKRPKAPSKNSHPKTKTTKDLAAPQRHVIYYREGIFSQGALDDIARHLWEQWSMNECDGQLTTPYWTEDILSLRNGDRIQVRLRPELEQEIRQIGDLDLAAKRLVEVYGIEDDVADILVHEAMRPLQDIYRVDSTTLKWPEGKATVKFFNLIRLEESEPEKESPSAAGDTIAKMRLDARKLPRSSSGL